MKEIAYMSVIILIVTVAVGSALGLAVVSNTSNIYGNMGVATKDVLALREYYNTGNDDKAVVNDTDWLAQTFTTGTVAHTVTSIKLRVYRVGTTPGDVSVGIGATLANAPVLNGLAGGTIDGDAFTANAAGQWETIAMNTEITLNATTKYAILVHADDSDEGNYVMWCLDKTTPGYLVGSEFTSADSGENWTPVTANDMMFEVWGNTVEYTEAGASFNQVTGIVYTSWPLLGLAVLGMIGAAVLASIAIFR